MSPSSQVPARELLTKYHSVHLARLEQNFVHFLCGPVSETLTPVCQLFKSLLLWTCSRSPSDDRLPGAKGPKCNYGIICEHRYAGFYVELMNQNSAALSSVL